MDPKLLENLKARVNDEAQRFAIIEEGHLEALAACIVTDEEDNAQVLDALEVIFYLSTEGSLRPKIAAVDGLVNNVKKFMSRGRLKQKKLAIMAYKNLQLAVPAAREDTASPLTEITNGDSLASIMSPMKEEPAPTSQVDETLTENKDGVNLPHLLMSKKANMAKTRPGVSLGARIRPAAVAPNGSSATSATTVNLYVEGMHSVEARTHVEQALLKKEGVISFFSDIADEKIVIRTMLSAEDLYAYVWDSCRMRASTVKGDYTTFKPSGYLDENANKGGWLWGISSLLQIIAVKNDGTNIPAPTPVKQTPAKARVQPQQATAQAGGPNGEKSWIKSWW